MLDAMFPTNLSILLKTEEDQLEGGAMTRRMIVAVLCGVLAGCGGGSQSAPSASSGPPTPSPSSPALTSTPTLTPTSSPTPSAPTVAQVKKVLGSAMIEKKAAAALGLTPSIESPVTGPQRWSFACDVTLKSDGEIGASAYQQWKRGTATVALELLVHYSPGGGKTAFAEAVTAVKSCKSYDFESMGTMRVIRIDPVKPTEFTYCEASQGPYLCHLVTRHGEYIRHLLGFGVDVKSAQFLTGALKGMSDPRLKAAGIT